MKGIMVLKLEKNGKIIKTWEFEQLDDRLEKSIIEMINTEYDLVRKLMTETRTEEAKA